MKELTKELLQILQEEMKIYNELLRMSKGKTDIIVKGKVTELDAIVKMEQSFILQFGEWEAQRENVVDKIAKVLDIEPSDLTMSALVDRFEPEQAKELRKYQHDLSWTLRELKELNDVNSKLVKNSLEFINFSLNLVTGVGDTGNNYGNTGQVHEQKKRNLFDMKL